MQDSHITMSMMQLHGDHSASSIPKGGRPQGLSIRLVQVGLPRGRESSLVVQHYVIVRDLFVRGKQGSGFEF